MTREPMLNLIRSLWDCYFNPCVNETWPERHGDAIEVWRDYWR